MARSRSARLSRDLLLFSVILLTSGGVALGQWPRFRGPNGSGVSDATGVPVEFGPDRAVAWSRPVPAGKSSPILVDGRLILTGIDDDLLVTLAFDAGTGDLLWRRDIERARRDEIFRGNDSATPTPASDGENVYVFFTELGLVSFDVQGNERWRHPLGPFENFYGIGTSPIVAAGLVLFVADQAEGSFLLALDAGTGEMRWRAPRPGRAESYTTPILYPSAERPRWVIAFGSTWVDAYELATGEHAWSVPGRSLIPVSSPTLAGSRLIVTAPGGGENDLPRFEEFLEWGDADEDGRLSAEEFSAMPGWGDHFGAVDRNKDGYFDAAEYPDTDVSDHGLVAIDVPDPEVGGEATMLWRQRQSVGSIATPVAHEGVVYMVADGGILSSVDADTGEVLKRGRLSRSPAENHSSPVLADGRLYIGSTSGELSVVAAGPEWEVLATNDLGDPIRATPVPADGRLFVRTAGRLYAFGGDTR